MLANLWEVQDNVNDADGVSFKDPIRHFVKALVTNAILQLTAQQHECHLSLFCYLKCNSQLYNTIKCHRRIYTHCPLYYLHLFN